MPRMRGVCDVRWAGAGVAGGPAPLLAVQAPRNNDNKRAACFTACI
jgi:hypothetical protein